MAFLAGYTTRKKLTIDQTKVDANLTDFPVLVKLTSSNFDFAKANADGFDIRFTSSDGTTLLKYERLRHDSANSLAEYWVKVPAVSGSVDTEIYMYYRTEDTADGADPTNVWDSYYKAVYHLNGSYGTGAGEVKDSTGNALHGTCVDAPTQATGQVSKCQDFNGSADYITLGDLAFAYNENSSIEVIASTDGIGGTNYRTIFEGIASGENIYPSLYHTTDNSLSIASFANKNPIIITAANFTTGTFFHFAITYDYKSSGPILTDTYVYANGVQTDSTLDDSHGTTNATSHRIGNDATVGTRYWDGKLEELRISKGIARSAAWIKASYNTCWNTLLTYGPEQTGFQPRQGFVNFQDPGIV